MHKTPRNPLWHGVDDVMCVEFGRSKGQQTIATQITRDRAASDSLGFLFGVRVWSLSFDPSNTPDRPMGQSQVPVNDLMVQCTCEAGVDSSATPRERLSRRMCARCASLKAVRH